MKVILLELRFSKAGFGGSGLWDLVSGTWSLGSGLSRTTTHPKAGAALEPLRFQVPAVVRISQTEAWIVGPDGFHSAASLLLSQPGGPLQQLTQPVLLCSLSEAVLSPTAPCSSIMDLAENEKAQKHGCSSGSPRLTTVT